jgi:CRISPR-associated protein Csm1
VQKLAPPIQLERLLYALQRHAWCLPSPLSAVSLYDFARTHAAIAAARAMHDDTVFLLGGDLSGVQAFLYTLTADGATKQLRGRSFYLQLLTDACARFMLTQAGLPLTNLLYSGGGRFYLLLPGIINGQPAAAWLATQRVALSAFLLRRHQGELYLALGGQPLPDRDLVSDPDDPGAFQRAWGRVNEDINRAKRRRFAELEQADVLTLFAPQGNGGNATPSCAVCGYQGTPDEYVAIPDDPQHRQRCHLCHSFEDLGRLLHNATYVILHHLKQPDVQTGTGRCDWQTLLCHLGLHVQLAGKHASLHEPANRAPSRQQVRWTTALALDLSTPALPTQPRVPGTVVYGIRPTANTTPTMHPEDFSPAVQAYLNTLPDDERPPGIHDVKPFSVMVAQSVGVKRLGVLRMDVDDLGDLFRYRLDSGLARVSALSAALALFFEGWIGQLCNEINDDPDQQGSVYCIYSGGDDLFIVGSWHLLLDLARRISDDLATYTGAHPDVHLSGGISLHGAKFPLYQAAEAAEAELKRAKHRQGKAALGWLEQVVAWTSFASPPNTQPDQTLLLDLKQQLAAEVQQQHLPHALLQTCQQLYLQYGHTLTRTKMEYGPWLWRGAYQLARTAARLGKDKPELQSARALLNTIRGNLLQGIDAPAHEGARFIERLGLAARWAQLELRQSDTHPESREEEQHGTRQ